MAFAPVNLLNRSRHYVRGRVLVFTDSLRVEFVEESLKNSYPLYSQLLYPNGHGLSFVVELPGGYLTFDQGAHYRILELGAFSSFYYDPTAFSIVSPADATPYYISDTDQDIELDGTCSRVYVIHDSEHGSAITTYQRGQGSAIPGPASHIMSVVTNTFPVNSVWQGPTGYPGWFFVKTEYTETSQPGPLPDTPTVTYYINNIFVPTYYRNSRSYANEVVIEATSTDGQRITTRFSYPEMYEAEARDKVDITFHLNDTWRSPTSYPGFTAKS